MKSKIAIFAVAVFAALSLSGCGDDLDINASCPNEVGAYHPDCPSGTSTKRQLTTIAVTTTTQSAATTTSQPTTTTSSTTTPTPTSSTVTVYATTPTTTVGTVTVYAPPPAAAVTTTTAAPPPATPKFTGYVNIGQAALCGGSPISSYDAGGITLNDANVVFRTNGFSLTPVSYPKSGTPPFEFDAVIVTQAGKESSFSGNLLLAPDGTFLTNKNAGYGDFWLNSTITADGFVFCDAAPSLR